MKKLTHSAAARAVAFILCLLCGLTALLCAAGYYMTQIDRDRTLPEPDSVSVYQNGIRVLLNNALQEERYTGEYPELPSGYSYVATDTSTGKVLYDGRTKNAVPLGISGGYFSEGVGIDVQAYLEPKQTPGEELTLSARCCAIRMPISPWASSQRCCVSRSSSFSWRPWEKHRTA